MNKAYILTLSGMIFACIGMGTVVSHADTTKQYNPALLKVYYDVDKNRSGGITMQEFMNYRGVPVSTDHEDYFEFRSIDTNDDNKISIRELKKSTNPENPTL